MIRQLLYRFTAKRPCRLISIGERPYLERYYVGQLFGATLYLHRFVRPDDERNVHDHPWNWSVGIVLAGGYVEERVTGMDPACGWHAKYRRIRPWRPNLIGRRTFHRITKPKLETWTLFIHGPRTKGWGFLYRITSIREVVYYQPYDTKSGQWWKSAPVGAVAGRMPLAKGKWFARKRTGHSIR